MKVTEPSPNCRKNLKSLKRQEAFMVRDNNINFISELKLLRMNRTRYLRFLVPVIQIP